MIVNGNIADVVVRRVGKNGKPYFTFRLAENQGKDEMRTTTWYDVIAFIPDEDGDLLSKSQYVRVIGKLEPKLYTKRDQTQGVALSVTAYKVELPPPLPPREGDGGQQGNGAPAGTAPRSVGTTPARAPQPARPPAQGFHQNPGFGTPPAPRPASGFDDMDDDIPF